MINSILNIKIDSIRLETQEISEGLISRDAHINISYQTENEIPNLNKLNLRLFISLDQGLSKSLDYIKQRYNEFMVLNPVGVSSFRYNKDIQFLLGQNANILKSSNPFSPYSTNLEVRDLVINNRTASSNDGSNIPDGMLIYDAPLSEITDSINNSVGLINTIKITLPESSTNLTQMSVYAYFYDTLVPSVLTEQREENFSLVTGMSLVSSAVPIGTKTLFLRTSQQNYILPPQEEKVISRPDVSILTVINKKPENAANKEYDNIVENSQKYLTPYQRTKNYELKKVINNKNYFSDLWLSRDNKDNHRFVFAFDIKSYLYNNGLFPFVYSNEVLSSAIIGGNNIFSPEQLSSVVSVQIFRETIAPSGFVGVNNLGTTGKKAKKEPNKSYSKIPVTDVKKVEIKLPQYNQSEQIDNIVFYEGYDNLHLTQYDDGQINGVFQYTVECVIEDHSPSLIRRIISLMYESKKVINIIENEITGRRLLIRSRNGSFIENINSLQILYNEKIQNASKLLLDVANLYDSYRSSIGENSRMEEELRSQINSNNGKISLELLSDLENKIESNITFLIYTLEKIYNKNISQAFIDSSKNAFNFNSSKSNLNNNLIVSHTFSDICRSGKYTGFGLEYIFDDTMKQDSLSTITVDEFEERRISEFNKYFSFTQGEEEIIPDGIYSDPSYSYMTAKSIKIPGRETIRQTRPSPNNGTAIDYDYVKYSQLFSDIVSLYDKKDKSGLSNSVSLSDINHVNFNNGVYSSVRETLGENFGLLINETPTPQFSPPSVLKGAKKSTIYNLRDLENCGPNAGLPLIQSIVGGESTQNSTTKSYLNQVDTKIKDQDTERSKGQIDRRNSKEKKKERAIKLPFVILGELTISTAIKDAGDERMIAFNSLTDLRKILNLTKDNVEDSLSNTFISSMPNQIKSMLAFSTTNESLSLGTLDGSNGFDATRPRMIQKDDQETTGNLISFFNDQEQIPPYPQTEDPMRSYAKFLAFWMNYRQIAVIEYLRGFQDLEDSIIQDQNSYDSQLASNKLKLSGWRTLDASIVQSLSRDGGSILCRVRTMGTEDYLQMFNDAGLSDSQQRSLVEYFHSKDMLNLPTYNQYFYINGGNQQNTSQQNLNTLNQQASFVIGY